MYIWHWQAILMGLQHTNSSMPLKSIAVWLQGPLYTRVVWSIYIPLAGMCFKVTLTYWRVSASRLYSQVTMPINWPLKEASSFEPRHEIVLPFLESIQDRHIKKCETPLEIPAVTWIVRPYLYPHRGGRAKWALRKENRWTKVYFSGGQLPCGVWREVMLCECWWTHAHDEKNHWRAGAGCD